MNPYGHEQGRDARPTGPPGLTYLKDFHADLLITREGGTIIPRSGDVPFHVNHEQVAAYIRHLQSVAAGAHNAMCVFLPLHSTRVLMCLFRETLNQLSTLYVLQTFLIGL